MQMHFMSSYYIKQMPNFHHFIHSVSKINYIVFQIWGIKTDEKEGNIIL